MPETNKSVTAPSQEPRTVWPYAIAALLSLVGLADAIYLTVEHVTGANVQCTVIVGCPEVLGSSYAQIGRMPLAALGALAYFTTFSLATLAAFGYNLARPLLALLISAMFLVTLWLLYLQAFVIRAFCQFCLLSAAVTVGLTITVLLASRLEKGKRVKG